MSKKIEELSHERSYAGGNREKAINRVKEMLYVNLSEHIKLYRLLREYDSISDDLELCKCLETKALLSGRLEEIKKRVQNDFIVLDMAKEK